MPTSVGTALSAYRTALNCLDARDVLTTEQALKILCTRDTLQIALLSEAPIAAERLQRIYRLDTQLKKKKNAAKILKAIDLENYRETLPEHPQSWWWNLDKTQPPHFLDRYEWFFNGLTFGSWTVSIALLINIASRFFSGGPDVVGAIAVILPSLFALLKAKSDLTEAGQKGFDTLLQWMRIPAVINARAKFSSTLILLIGLLFFWQKLPQVSQFYSRLGLNHYRADELSSAEINYQRAISLDPNNAEAHYNLGRLYEDWLRFDDAEREYQIAVSANIPRAHNNLARLYILEKNYSEAVSLLIKGLRLVEEELTLPEESRSIYPEDHYNLLKNLAWVRFEQSQYENAEKLLSEAILISNNPEIIKYVQSRASVHCILAQVLELGGDKDAHSQWELCQQLADSSIPEEDTWLNLADEYLQNAQDKDVTP